MLQIVLKRKFFIKRLPPHQLPYIKLLFKLKTRWLRRSINRLNTSMRCKFVIGPQVLLKYTNISAIGLFQGERRYDVTSQRMRTRRREKRGSAPAQRWISVNAEKREARKRQQLRSHLQIAAEKRERGEARPCIHYSMFPCASVTRSDDGGRNSTCSQHTTIPPLID